MKKYFRIILLFLIATISLNSVVNHFDFTIPKGWPKPVYDFSHNPLTQNKISLGRALFYDPILSKDNTISCASCHSPFTAFAHVDHALSHGIADRIGKRNAPVLVNLAWQTSFMWDGAITSLDEQPLRPISHPDEMGSKMEEVIDQLNQSPLYRELFYEAYSDSTITKERMMLSLSQFLLTLVSAHSKYDSVMRKEASFTRQEKKGYQLFKKNCASCHREPLFTDFSYQKNGLPINAVLNDKGRMSQTGNSDDSLKFKVPTLRNIEFSFPYMHDGRFAKLSGVLNFYSTISADNENVSGKLKNGIKLTSDEKVDLLSFLLTLTDKQFLFNPDFQYPRDIFLKGN